jgi:hypothetical protein
LGLDAFNSKILLNDIAGVVFSSVDGCARALNRIFSPSEEKEGVGKPSGISRDLKGA